jgi:uncharacterized pyridoxamine 5'-phosphate oxidase family protein
LPIEPGKTLERIANASVATVSPDGRPWNSPLYVAFDANLTFYWSSHNDAAHSRNITTNPDVFLVVFDSTMADQSGQALYIRATARELNDETSIAVALDCLARRKNEPSKAPGDFIGRQPRRVYQAVPDEIGTNVIKEEHGHEFDERVVVDLMPNRSTL